MTDLAFPVTVAGAPVVVVLSWQHANAKLAQQWLARNDVSVGPVSLTTPATAPYGPDMTKEAVVMS